MAGTRQGLMAALLVRSGEKLRFSAYVRTSQKRLSENTEIRALIEKCHFDASMRPENIANRIYCHFFCTLPPGFLVDRHECEMDNYILELYVVDSFPNFIGRTGSHAYTEEHP